MTEIREFRWVKIIAVRVVLGECMALLLVPGVRAQSASITVSPVTRNIAAKVTVASRGGSVS